MNDREIKGIAIVGGLVLLGTVIAGQAYEAGLSAGLVGSGRVPAGAYHGGFHFFPPLWLIIIGGVLFLIWRKRERGGGPGAFGRGPGGGGPPRFFEEWHRQAHQAERTAPVTPVTPVTPAPAAPQGPEAGSAPPTGPTGPTETGRTGSGGPETRIV